MAESANSVKDVTIPLHKFVNANSIIASLTKEFGFAGNLNGSGFDVIHLDIAHEVM